MGWFGKGKFLTIEMLTIVPVVVSAVVLAVLAFILR